jgi:hypothetical protein
MFDYLSNLWNSIFPQEEQQQPVNLQSDSMPEGKLTKYSSEETTFIINHPEMSNSEIGQYLGRTKVSVYKKRQALKKKGLIPYERIQNQTQKTNVRTDRSNL